jgi:hypothetical protein
MSNNRSNILGHFQVLGKKRRLDIAGSSLMSKADANLTDQPIMTKNAKKTMFCDFQEKLQRAITNVMGIYQNGKICPPNGLLQNYNDSYTK